MKLIGEWRYHAAQRAAFADGTLATTWASRYPRVFDELDRALVKNQPRSHFYEWLVAVLLFESAGMLSLVQKYQFGKHQHKQRVLQALMPRATAEWLTSAPRPCQGPDLLVYAPDHSEWYFVEVKGPTDRMRPVQRSYFAEIEDVTGRPVHVVRLRQMPRLTRARAGKK